jgi:hypothetical protein
MPVLQYESTIQELSVRRLSPEHELGDDGEIHALAEIDPAVIQKLREHFGITDPGKDQIHDLPHP